MKDIRAAAAMSRAVVGDIAGNLARTRELAAAAARKGAGLVVFPEAGLTGYTVRESMAPFAEPVPGPLTREVERMAAEFNLIVSAGLIEQGTSGRQYITQILAGPEGLAAKYRKTHLGPTEMSLFEPGDRLGYAKTGGIHFGLQLCYEGHFPEITLAQALKGIDMVLIPHASPRETPPEKIDRWLRYLPARAYDNTVFLIAVNQAGDNGGGLRFAGVGLIIGPKGEVLARGASQTPDLVVADLSAAVLNSVRESRMGHFLPLRRPDLYGL